MMPIVHREGKVWCVGERPPTCGVDDYGTKEYITAKELTLKGTIYHIPGYDYHLYVLSESGKSFKAWPA